MIAVLGIPGFFEPAVCRWLRAQTRAGELGQAQVRTTAAGEHVDPEHRRTRISSVSPVAQAFVNESLRRLRPWISNHYRLVLNGFEKPQFLLYGPSDFFRAHADGPPPHEYPVRWRCRKVSVIAFLNGEIGSEPEASFTGGLLVFRGEGGAAFPVTPAEGLLVAFPSHHPHEVLPITSGERFTVVSWYF